MGGVVTLASVLIIGFLLGIKHATEADHLAAVATLATRESSLGQTMKQGAAWGIGHTFTLMLFGGIVLALGKSIPQTMEQALELAVGVMLVGLGADVLRRVLQQRIHFHVHTHEVGTHETGAQKTDVRHVHAHGHPRERDHRNSLHRHEHRLPLRALAIGMMHGMAGSAALILLSLETVQSVTVGLLYIVLFGVGSILGMALLSVAIAVPLKVSTGYLTSLHHGLTGAVGVFSCALGAFMVYRIGFVERLLSLADH